MILSDKSLWRPDAQPATMPGVSDQPQGPTPSVRPTDMFHYGKEQCAGWLRDNLWPTFKGSQVWPRIVVAVVAVFALVGVGVAAGQGGVKEANARAVKAEAAVASVKAADQTTIDALQSEVAAQTAKVDQLQGQAASVTAHQSAIDQQKAALDQTAAAQAATAAKLAQQQQAVNASSFGDGLYQVGRDIQAGQYHTVGAAGCYWAKLRSWNTTDIADNNISSGAADGHRGLGVFHVDPVRYLDEGRLDQVPRLVAPGELGGSAHGDGQRASLY